MEVNLRDFDPNIAPPVGGFRVQGDYPVDVSRLETEFASRVDTAPDGNPYDVKRGRRTVNLERFA